MYGFGVMCQQLVAALEKHRASDARRGGGSGGASASDVAFVARLGAACAAEDPSARPTSHECLQRSSTTAGWGSGCAARRARAAAAVLDIRSRGTAHGEGRGGGGGAGRAAGATPRRPPGRVRRRGRVGRGRRGGGGGAEGGREGGVIREARGGGRRRAEAGERRRGGDAAGGPPPGKRRRTEEEDRRAAATAAGAAAGRGAASSGARRRRRCSREGREGTVRGREGEGVLLNARDAEGRLNTSTRRSFVETTNSALGYFFLFGLGRGVGGDADAPAQRRDLRAEALDLLGEIVDVAGEGLGEARPPPRGQAGVHRRRRRPPRGRRRRRRGEGDPRDASAWA